MEIVLSFDTTGSMASCIQEVHRKKIFYSKSNMKSITKINSLSNLLVINYRPQRSWAKVIFSQACVKNSVHGGGVCLSACWDTPQEHTPPRTRHTPREQTPRERTAPGVDPPDQAPPGSRPPWEQTPPPPAGKQTAAYGQLAAGTHPTGMHSC